MKLTQINVVKIGRRMRIFEQLRLEEALLRSDTRNWCLLNVGCEPPAVVMGISGVADKLLNVDLCKKREIPVIRRFTGGGTVVVDSNTLFVSLICNKSDIAGQPLYPREVMSWSATSLYGPLFDKLAARRAPAGSASSFSLREHDYCLGDKKFAGNAQAISRERWVHHTSFLWTFAQHNMALLQLPEKRPAYREDRDHHEFLTPLADHVSLLGSSSSSSSSERSASDAAVDDSLASSHGHPGGDAMFHELVAQLRRGFDVVETPLEEALAVQERPQERIGTVLVPLH